MIRDHSLDEMKSKTVCKEWLQKLVRFKLLKESNRELTVNGYSGRDWFFPAIIEEPSSPLH